MTASELLDAVAAGGGKVWLHGDKIRARLPDNLICLVDEMRDLKPQLIELLIECAPDSPDAWREDFARWRAERCVSRQGYEDSAGIGCLLLDFAEWCIGHDAVPCQRATFETLVEEAGFRCADGMAAGLVLKVDLEAVLCSQAAPEASRTRARAT
jgi:hypothetical protein